MPAASRTGRFNNKKIVEYIKKRGNLYLLLVPHIKAFELPTQSERATQKPTPICMTSQTHLSMKSMLRV